eukprot:jgi/Botrbrau1/2825/Bobra.0125s0034.2
MVARSDLAAPLVLAFLYLARRGYAQTTLPTFSQISTEDYGSAAKFSPDPDSNFAWLTVNPTDCSKPAAANSSSWHINLGSNYVVHGLVLTGYNVSNDGGQRVEVRVGEQNPMTTSATANPICTAFTMVAGDPSARHACDRSDRARYVTVTAPDNGQLDVCAISLIVENPQGNRAFAPGPMPLLPAPLGTEAPAQAIPLPPGIMLPTDRPIGPSNEMPIMPGGGRPLQASMGAADAPVGPVGPIVPRRPLGPALAPAPFPENTAPINRLAAATQAAEGPTPLLAIGPAQASVPSQVIAASSPSPVVVPGAGASSGVQAAVATPSVAQVPASLPPAASVEAGTPTASVKVATEAPKAAAAAGTSAATTAAATTTAVAATAHTPTPAAADHETAHSPKPAAQVQGEAETSNEPPLISREFFPPVTTAEGLTSTQKIGIGVGTAAGVLAIGGVVGLVLASRKKGADKSLA